MSFELRNLSVGSETFVKHSWRCTCSELVFLMDITLFLSLSNIL